MRSSGKESVPVSFLSIVMCFARLGLVGFGGPTAHIALFHTVFVTHRRWVGDEDFARLLAISQALPGPSSSQLAAALGWRVRGWAGGLGAILAFAAPSLAIMIALGLGAGLAFDAIPSGVIAGLTGAVAGIVASALLHMIQSLANGLRTAAIALGAFSILVATSLVMTSLVLVQPLVLIAAGLIGAGWLRQAEPSRGPALELKGSRRWPLLGVALVLGLLLFSFWVSPDAPRWVLAASENYRAGAFVFGGGHVVLPMLEPGVVPELMSEERFLAGYGAAQALPGPIFAFAGYIGALSGAGGVDSALSGLISAAAIFLPGLVLLFSALSFWSSVLSHPRVRSALAGINAAVVGVLAAAFINPVATTAAMSLEGLLTACAAFLLVQFGRWPAPLVVISAGLTGWGLSLIT
ncbi:MAG: chromate efflux transporter [Pseudomonadota bacterium]